MPLSHSELVVVKQVKGKGRGVFARRPIRAGEVIERVPVLVFTVEAIDDPVAWGEIAQYAFLWGKGTIALALGYGSLYNHSYCPNARYDDEPRKKVFTALRDIADGEEITINYNGDPNDQAPVGFDVLEDPARARKATRARRTSPAPAPASPSR